MILELYYLLLAITIGMVLIGLFWSTHSELAIVGFIFAFLLGLMMMNGQVEYKIGNNSSSDLFYSGSDVVQVNQTFTYQYTPFNNSDSTVFGKYTMIGSALGFVVMLFLLGRSF